MSAKIIVCVTAQGAIAAVFEHGKLGPGREFDPGEDGRRAFGDLLHDHPGSPVYLMADSVEEDYHTEMLPHVSGAARKELLRRKLKQHYRGTSYYSAWIQGREQDKRCDDQYLFVALTNPEMLHVWLETLNAFQAPLAGIYLLPMVTQELVRRLDLAMRDLLVVSKHSGGLRQSFLQGGQLKASRLALTDREHGGLAAEIGKTRLYLGSLRLTARESKLAVLLLDTDGDMAALQTTLHEDMAYLDVLRLSHDELSAIVGNVPLRDAHALHMAVLGLQCPANDLAPADAIQNYRQSRQRRSMVAASVVVAGVALLWTGENLYQRHRLTHATQQLEAETQTLQARYGEISKAFPQTPASADKLEKTVQLAIRIQRDSHTPENALLAIARALEASPEIMLTRLSWKYGAPGQEAGLAEAAAQANAPGWRESALVEGEIRPFRGDYRQAMASVKRFAEDMAHDPDVASANVVQLPLDIHASTVLSGTTPDAGNAQTARAEFKIRVLLKART